MAGRRTRSWGAIAAPANALKSVSKINQAAFSNPADPVERTDWVNIDIWVQADQDHIL